MNHNIDSINPEGILFLLLKNNKDKIFVRIKRKRIMFLIKMFFIRIRINLNN